MSQRPEGPAVGPVNDGRSALGGRSSYPPSCLQQYRSNVYSQNGEDGVIREVLRRLEIDTGWFCEFGAWDGRYGSNTYALLRRGWRGVMIEGEPTRFLALQRTAGRYPKQLIAIQEYVSPNPGPCSLDDMLAATHIPNDFEILSIDVDGCDYHIFESLTAFNPLVIIIEIDSSIPPGVEKVHSDSSPMTSFTSMLRLGQRKGYELVCHTGNMVFVRSDRVNRLNLPLTEAEQPERLFTWDWVEPTLLDTWLRKLRNLTPQRLVIKIANALWNT